MNTYLHLSSQIVTTKTSSYKIYTEALNSRLLLMSTGCLAPLALMVIPGSQYSYFI